jgi:hypothetical protein
MPTDFGNILETIKQGIVSIAADSLKDFSKEAIADGNEILRGIEPKLKKWSLEVAEGKMTPDDLKDLVLGEKDNMQLVALKHKGFAMIRADKFKADVLHLIIKTITAVV